MMTIHEEVTAGNVLERVGSLLIRKYRFVTMTAVDCGDHFDVYYHFDKDFELYNLRVKAEKPGVLPSVSKICFAALIIENEIQDLFGISFTGLSIDYEHHFLLGPDAPVKPFCHVPGVQVTTVENPAVAKGAEK